MIKLITSILIFLFLFDTAYSKNTVNIYINREKVAIENTKKLNEDFKKKQKKKEIKIFFRGVVIGSFIVSVSYSAILISILRKNK